MSLCISYDSSFDGFLSVVFEVYRQRLDVGDIRPDRVTADSVDLFQQPFRIETSDESARRLKRAIINAAGEDILQTLEVAFRSEETGIEKKIFVYLQRLFSGLDKNFARNPASSEMLPLFQMARAVRREVGGMLGMVRFSKTSDGTYFSEIEPKYDILDLMVGHFRGRFAGERWAIYDSKRKYGVYYDGHSASEVYIPNLEAITADTPPDTITQLWKDYYNAISIKERENPRLLRRSLPVHYWKHLPERQTTLSSGVPHSDGSLYSIGLPYSGNLPSAVAKSNATLAIGRLII